MKAKIIKNNSYDDPKENNPDKHCPEPKEVNGKSFLLDEELPGEAEQILGKKGD